MNSLRVKIVRLFKWNNRLQELWLFTKYGIIRNKRCFLGVHRCMNSPTHSQTLHEALRASFSLWVSWSRSYTWWTPENSVYFYNKFLLNNLYYYSKNHNDENCSLATGSNIDGSRISRFSILNSAALVYLWKSDFLTDFCLKYRLFITPVLGPFYFKIS